MNLPRPPRFADRELERHFLRVQQELEQGAKRTWYLDRDVEHPHALTVRGNFQLADSTAVTAILDEDTLSSNSATALATQQSIKAYVDSAVSGASHTLDSLSDVAITSPASAQVVRYNGNSWVNATLAFADLGGTPTTLAGYGITDAASSGHTHAFTDLTSKPTTLAGYGITDAASSGHTHAFADLTGKPTTLAGYGITDAASSGHTHAFADLTGKPTTLAGYGITDAASSLHNHALDGLSNVTITSNSSGEILTWNGSAWINQTLAELGIGSSSVADLDDLGDVSLATETLGDLLRYNGSVWVNASLSEAGLASSSVLTTHINDTDNPHSTTIDNLSNVDNTGKQDGDILVWDANGSVWAATAQSIGTLGGLSDVSLSSPTTGHYLRYLTGTGWQNTTIAAGDLPPHTHTASQIDSGVFPVARGGTGQTSFTTSKFIWYNGSELVSTSFDNTSFASASHNHTLDSLSNLTIAAKAGGDILVWDDTGNVWYNTPLAGSHTHAFADITSKPTTVSGYGITDAVTTAGAGLSKSGFTISLAFNELSDRTFTGTDKLVFYSPDGGGHFTDIASGIPISVFQNTSLIDTISAGTGIAVTGSGTSRTISIDYDASNLITDATDAVSVASGDWILLADADATPNNGLRKAQVSTWPYKGTVTSVTAGLGLGSTGSADAPTLNVGEGAGILVDANDVSLDFSAGGLSSATAASGDFFAFYDVSASGMRNSSAGTIPLSIFSDDLGYKNVQGGAGITVTSGPTYNTISVNGASGGSGFFQTAWDQATTPISTDAMVFGDGGLTGTASTVLFSNVPVGIFQNDGTYALNSALTSHVNNTSNPHSVTKSQVGLGNVENTALSTWAGSTYITTLGTISTGTVPAANVGAGQFGGAFTIQGAFAPSANNTYALGASGAAWAKVWTYDLDVANNTIFGGNLTVGNTSGDLFIPNGQVLADGGGTVSAPSYSFDNDLNTGIYPAGADTLGFATGGTQRVTIDSSGNVGIGTATPTNYYSGADNLVIYQAADAGITIATGTTNTGALYFADGTTGDAPYRGGIGYQHNTDLLALVAGGAARVWVDGTGNVGIGVTSMAGSANLYLAAGKYLGYSASAYMTPEDNVSGARIKTPGQIVFEAGGSEKMRINTSGYVGIGTATPAYPLQVRRAGGAGSLGISVDNVGSISRVAQYFAIGDDITVTSGHAFYTRNATATDNLAVIIDNTGNVGIGTSSPGDKLSVQGSGAVYASVTNTGSGSARLKLFNTGDTSDGFALINNSGVSGQVNILNYKNSTMAFWTNATQQLTIDSSGKVGIGTASPTNPLTVENTSTATGLAANNILKIKNLSTATDTRAGIVFGNIGAIGSALCMQSAILKNGTTGEYDMIWDLYGGSAGWQQGLLYLDSNPGRVGIGTTSPSYKLHVVGDVVATV